MMKDYFKDLCEKEFEWPLLKMTDPEYVEEAIHHLEADNIYYETVIDALREDCEIASVSDSEIILRINKQQTYQFFSLISDKISDMINSSLRQLHPEIFTHRRKVIFRKPCPEKHTVDDYKKLLIETDYSASGVFTKPVPKETDKKGWYVYEQK